MSDLIREETDWSDLQSVKDIAIIMIDRKIEAGIFAGFTYDGNLFSMSLSAQINWSNLLNIPEVAFPLTLSLKNDTGFYSLSYANRMNFYLASMNHKVGVFATYNVMKNSVINATEINEVLNIINAL